MNENRGFLRSDVARLATLAACFILGVLLNALGPYVLYHSGVDGMVIESVFPLVGYALIALGLFVFFYNWIRQQLSGDRADRTSSPLEAELQQAIQRAEQQPQKAKPAWDLARVRLELYFDRNISQINYIFWLSVLVMLVGFGFIIFGIAKSFAAGFGAVGETQEATESAETVWSIAPAMVGTIVGVITEFIGATFLFIYRSTIRQAGTYVKTLERINSVGMAMQIMDTISPKARELQDNTKAEMVKVLLSQVKEEVE